MPAAFSPVRTIYVHSLLRWCVAVLIVGSLIGCQSEADQPTLSGAPTDVSFRKDGTLTFVRPDGTPIRTIDIEIADTDSAVARGLMDRRSMGFDKGMLFIFPEANDRGFWMRNTPLPLDIIFVSPDSQVINIAERTKPFSEAVIEPEAPKRFVVEVRAGFTERFGLTDSTRVTWTRE